MENSFIVIIGILGLISGVILFLIYSIFPDNRSRFTEENFNKSLNKQLVKLFPKTKNLTKILWVGDEHRLHP